MPPQKIIHSFLLRFIQEAEGENRHRRSWRGLIKHVQSDKEQPFVHISEALDFIRRYVDWDELPRC